MEITRVVRTVLILCLCDLILAEIHKKGPEAAAQVPKPPAEHKHHANAHKATLKKVEVPPPPIKVKLPDQGESPVWQKKMKEAADKEIEGAGDGDVDAHQPSGEVEGDFVETETDADDADGELEEYEGTADAEDDEEALEGAADDEGDDDGDDEGGDDGDDEEEPEEEKKDYLEWHEKVKMPEAKKRNVPSLVMLSKHLLLGHIKSRRKFIVNIGNLGCEKCQKFYEEYRLILHYFHDTKQKIDTYLVTEKQLLDDYGFQKDEYPAILYYRHGVPILYEGPLTATGVQSWVENHTARAAKELTDDNFDTAVDVTDDKSTQWLVLFYDPLDPKCWRPLAVTETLATKKTGINIGLVDVTKNKLLSGKLKDQNKIPSWVLFRKGDTVQLEFYERLTLQHLEESYKLASLTFQEKLGKAAIQVRGFLLYTGGAITVSVFVFMFVCRRVANVGSRQIKKGV